MECRRCGSAATDVRLGRDLSPETHWPQYVYRVCRACGCEQLLTPKGLVDLEPDGSVVARKKRP
jgi:hypothetical protein